MENTSLKRILYVVAAVLLVAAFVVALGWLAPENPRDAAEVYQALIALGLGIGFAGMAVR